MKASVELPLLALDVRIEKDAQLLVDVPLLSSVNLGLFEVDMEHDYYPLMLDRQPDKAAKLIARLLRQVAFAAMSNEVYMELLREITPRLERGEPAADDPAFPGEYPAVDETLPPLKGTCAQLVHCFMRHITNASQTVFSKADEQPASPEHHLWQTYQLAYDQFARLHSDLELPGARPNWHNVMHSNAETVLDVLLHNGYYNTTWLNQLPNKKQLLRYAVKNLDQLTFPAGSKRSFTVPNLHTNPLSQEFHLFEYQELPPICSGGGLFAGRAPICYSDPLEPDYIVYQHPSFRKGPWRRSGFCPGVPILEPREQSDRDIVERFFVAMEERYGISILRALDAKGKGDGSFDRVTVAILLGILIAEDTIFDAWPIDNYPYAGPRDMHGSY